MIQIKRLCQVLIFASCCLILFCGSINTTKGQDNSPKQDSVAWSPNGLKIAVAGEFGVRLYSSDLQSFAQLQDASIPALTIAWNPDGSKLATGNLDNKVRVWDTKTGHLLLSMEGHTKPIFGLAWSPDGFRLASSGQDNTIRVWNSQTGELIYTLQETAPIWTVSWSPDGTKLASGGSFDEEYGIIKIWDATTGNFINTFPGPQQGAVGTLNWSPNNLILVSLSNEIQVWDTTGNGKGSILCAAGTSTALALAPDSNRVASAGIDASGSSLCISDLNGQILAGFHFPIYSIASLGWSPNGKSVALIAGDGLVRIIDATSGLQIAYTLTPEASFSSLQHPLGLCVNQESALYTMLSGLINNNQPASFIATVTGESGKQIDTTCANRLITLATQFLSTPVPTITFNSTDTSGATQTFVPTTMETDSPTSTDTATYTKTPTAIYTYTAPNKPPHQYAHNLPSLPNYSLGRCAKERHCWNNAEQHSTRYKIG